MDDFLTSGRNFQLFYDGACPLCDREISWLKRLDKQNRVLFTDIASPDFAADAYEKSFDQLMDQIHGRLPDGRWTVGVETFRQLYQAMGMGWVAGWTAWPGIRYGIDGLYWIFAKNRLRITGRWHKGCEATDGCRVDAGNARELAADDLMTDDLAADERSAEFARISSDSPTSIG